jgi:hypothetical protein
MYGEALIGAEPQRFTFKGKIASVPVRSDNAQTVIDHFKIYLQMATRGYQRDLNEAAARRDREERAALEAQKRAAEERAQVLAKLKI